MFNHFEVSDHWVPIVEEMVRKLYAIDPAIEFLQIKEKFGQLRVYYRGSGNERVDEIIRQAEHECSYTCEVCGAKDATLTTVKGWIGVRCLRHEVE